MNTQPIFLCGRAFTPELILHLNRMIAQQPDIRRRALACEVCAHLDWYSPRGQPALSSAKVALRKLHRRGLLRLPDGKAHSRRPHRLRPSGQPLPSVAHVPRRVERVQGLRLYLISGAEDPLHGLWNDLIMQQHPCGDAPLVGAQLRYLIESDHGCLGAIGFGPPAFLLGARDQWIGWSSRARVKNLRQVVGLARLLIRQEVHCTNLASKVLSMVLERLPSDWENRYGVRPVLVETFVDRSRFTGLCFAAANWLRLGTSTGRGRLGPKGLSTTPKDIWVYPLSTRARQELQKEPPQPVTPSPLMESLLSANWCANEMHDLDLGDERLNRRAQQILSARWNDPAATFFASFPNWAEAKGAYNLIEQKRTQINMQSLLASHTKATLARIASEPLVLLAQDTTSLNYSGLKKTSGLGPINHEGSRGMFLHSLLAWRPDGTPLGILDAQCWSRTGAPSDDRRTRNAKSIDEKESVRWLQALAVAADAARRLPKTTIIMLADREGDLYELHDAVGVGPSNLHIVIRSQHNRKLECHQKLRSFMADQPVGLRRRLEVPRRHNERPRIAEVEVRWAEVTIQAPAVGPKKGWPSLTLWAIWVHESDPPPGTEPLDWMLLTDLPVTSAAEAWEKVQWYCRRWGIEEWHRVLKSGCSVEQREFETAEHLRRALAFDLILAWRILALLKMGRAAPEMPADLLFSPDEIEVLKHTDKKNARTAPLTLQQASRLVSRLGGWKGRTRDGEPGAESLGNGLRRLSDMVRGWRLHEEQAGPIHSDARAQLS